MLLEENINVALIPYRGQGLMTVSILHRGTSRQYK
jgi:hypothetical protein